MSRFEIVFYGLVLFVCSILITLSIVALDQGHSIVLFKQGETLDYGPLSGWASAFVALIAVGFAALSYRNSRRSLDLSNTSYMAKVIETFADRANDKIKEITDCKLHNKKEDLLQDFIYSLYEITRKLEGNYKYIEILCLYLDKYAMNEITTASQFLLALEGKENKVVLVDPRTLQQEISYRSTKRYKDIFSFYEYVFKILNKNRKKHIITNIDCITNSQKIKKILGT